MTLLQNVNVSKPLNIVDFGFLQWGRKREQNGKKKWGKKEWRKVRKVCSDVLVTKKLSGRDSSTVTINTYNHCC